MVSRGTLETRELFDLSEVWFSALFEKETTVWGGLAPKKKERWIEENIVPNVSSLKRQGSLVMETQEITSLAGKAVVEAGAFVVGNDIEIRAGVHIEAGAWIQGPTILGEETVVRQGAYVRGGVITGFKAVIGHTSEVKSSILLNGAKAAHFAYVGDSILGNHVNLGAGTKISNLRFDHQAVVLRQGETKIETGFRKFGAILGDETETGCNCVLNPGTILGPKSAVYPCKAVSGRIYPAGSVLR